LGDNTARPGGMAPLKPSGCDYYHVNLCNYTKNDTNLIFMVLQLKNTADRQRQRKKKPEHE